MFLRIIFSIVLLLGAVSASARDHHSKRVNWDDPEFRPYGQGLPLPWPFPWAKECPVLWSSISGRYLLVDTQDQEVELQISVVSDHGLKVLELSRFNHDGGMISAGFAFLSNDQRSVRVYMKPLGKKVYPAWANISFYHHAYSLACDMEKLVPILGITEKRPSMNKVIQYRLVRRPDEI